MTYDPTTTNFYKPAKLANFEIHTWTEPTGNYAPFILRQLIYNKSSQERIVDRTDDATKRFKDLDTYKLWSSTGKLFFALTDFTGDVGGLIWFGRRHCPEVPDADTTFAIRMYDDYAGKGLARPFMNVAHFMLPRLMDVTPNVWLEVDEDNTRARFLYTSFGYEEIGMTDAGRVLMSYHRLDESKNE